MWGKKNNLPFWINFVMDADAIMKIFPFFSLLFFLRFSHIIESFALCGCCRWCCEMLAECKKNSLVLPWRRSRKFTEKKTLQLHRVKLYDAEMHERFESISSSVASKRDESKIEDCEDTTRQHYCSNDEEMRMNGMKFISTESASPTTTKRATFGWDWNPISTKEHLIVYRIESRRLGACSENVSWGWAEWSEQHNGQKKILAENLFVPS